MPAPSETPPGIAERIRQLSDGAGAVALARAAGVSQETVRRYLRGRGRPPSARFLQKLCEELGISGDWLLRGEGPARSRDLPHSALRSASGIQLVLALGAALDGLGERITRIEAFARRLERMEGAEPTVRRPAEGSRIPVRT